MGNLFERLATAMPPPAEKTQENLFERLTTMAPPSAEKTQEPSLERARGGCLSIRGRGVHPRGNSALPARRRRTAQRLRKRRKKTKRKIETENAQTRNGASWGQLCGSTATVRLGRLGH